MTTQTEEVLLKISGDSSGGERALKKLEQALKPLQDRLDRASAAGKTLGLVFGGLSAAGGKLIQSTSQVAMRNEVLANSLHIVGENAGYTRQELDYYTDAVKAKGITTQQSLLGITRMIQAELDLARATDVSRTAQDLAVIAGENSSETYGTIMQSVTALQPRLLRQYGIVATTNQILGDLANSTDVAAKRNRFLQFVLDEGAKVAGAYEGAMTLVGKRITSIPRLVEEAKASFGKYFLPVIGKGVDIVSKLLKAFNALPESVKQFLANIVLIGTTFSGLIASAGGFMAILPAILKGLKTLAALFGVTASSMGGLVSGIATAAAPVLAVIAAIAAAVYLLYKAWVNDWGGIATAVREAWTKIKPLIDDLVQLVKGWASAIGGEVRQIWTLIKSYLIPIFASISGLAGTIDWSGIFVTLKDAINVASNLIRALLQTIRGILSGEGLSAFAPLEDAMVNVLTMIALVWKKYISKALTWGYNLIVQAANGIISAAQRVMVSAMNAVGKIIGLFLAPGSPPKKGPLSKLVEWGKGLINTYVQSFKLADFSILRDSLSPIKDALENAIAVGDLDDAGFVEVFGKVREQVSGLIANFRETGEISEQVLANIGESLGPGSEELVKYLRLQLQHRKALEDLADIQSEVAAAEAKGFVPQALKDKLAAAEETAGAAQDELDWQREYLAVQQESVDIQMRLVNAMERLASASEGALNGASAGLGDAVIEGPELDVGDLALEPLTGGLEDVRVTLGGMSEEFLEMKGKVQDWIATFREWLTLPLDEKLTKLIEWVETAMGIDFSGYWDKAGQAVKPVIEAVTNVGSWLSEHIPASVSIAQKAWTDVFLPALDEITKIITETIIPTLKELAEGALALVTTFSETLSDYWSTVLLPAITLVRDFVSTSIIPILRSLARVYIAALSLATRILAGVWKNVLQPALKSVQKFVQEKVIKAFRDLANTAIGWVKSKSEALANFWNEKLKPAFETMTIFLKETLGPTFDWFREHILEPVANALDDIAYYAGQFAGWLDSIASKLNQIELPDWLESHSPPPLETGLRGIADAARLASGEFGNLSRQALSMELGQLRAVLASGGVNLSQQFGDMVFPNVRDGGDAIGVRIGLERMALESAMAGRTTA